MKTYKSLLEQAVAELTAAGVPEPDINAWYLLSWAIAIGQEEDSHLTIDREAESVYDDGKASVQKDGVSDDVEAARFALDLARRMPDKAWYMLHACDEAADAVQECLVRFTGYRCKGCPLEYITHYTEFMGLPFYVDPSVLIPRQDTECLVEEAIKISSGKDVLDLCTGSGCIAVSISKLGDAGSVTASDKSKEALKVAGINAAINDTDIRFLQGDMFKALGGTDDTYRGFDIITCNPPYIRRPEIHGLMREVRDYEPVMALDGGDDGLVFYRKLALEAGEYLRRKGVIMVEIGYDQADDVTRLFRGCHFKDIRVIKDLAGNDRVVTAVK